MDLNHLYRLDMRKPTQFDTEVLQMRRLRARIRPEYECTKLRLSEQVGPKWMTVGWLQLPRHVQIAADNDCTIFTNPTFGGNDITMLYT
jgi:hypothetical protein